MEGVGGLHLKKKKKKKKKKTDEERPASRAPNHPRKDLLLRHEELIEGYAGLERTGVVGVRYGTPLYVHLRGTKNVPGREPQVEKVTRSTCPKPGKTSYTLVRERPTYLETERSRAGVIAGENETTNRRRILAADGRLCVHTIGSSGLFGLSPSFHVPQPRTDRMRTGKTGAFVSRNAAAQQRSSTVRVRTGLL